MKKKEKKHKQNEWELNFNSIVMGKCILKKETTIYFNQKLMSLTNVRYSF